MNESGNDPSNAFPRRRFLGGLAAAGSAFTLPAGVFGQGVPQPGARRKGQFDPKALAAAAPKVRNVILMISDGCGFNGWLAADHFQGRAGTQPYQVARPNGTRPYVGATAHHALRLFGPAGKVLDNDQWDAARGVEEQGYDPRDRWTRLEGAFANDFGKVSIPYTSYTDSGAAGTALHSGRKTTPGRINMNWDGTEEFQTIAHIAHGQGRATGSVTTVPVSHATPGSVWARVPHRDLPRHEHGTRQRPNSDPGPSAGSKRGIEIGKFCFDISLLKNFSR